jgi:hypothetical protein
LNRGKIGTNNPSTRASTHASTDLATPTDGPERGAISVGPDGNLWFTEAGVEKLGGLTPTLVFVATAEPPAFVAPGAPFGLTITVAYLSGPTDTGFNGNLTLALFNPNTNGAALLRNAHSPSPPGAASPPSPDSPSTRPVPAGSLSLPIPSAPR